MSPTETFRMLLIMCNVVHQLIVRGSVDHCFPPPPNATAQGKQAQAKAAQSKGGLILHKNDRDCNVKELNLEVCRNPKDLMNKLGMYGSLAMALKHGAKSMNGYLAVGTVVAMVMEFVPMPPSPEMEATQMLEEYMNCAMNQLLQSVKAKIKGVTKEIKESVETLTEEVEGAVRNMSQATNEAVDEVKKAREVAFNDLKQTLKEEFNEIRGRFDIVEKKLDDLKDHIELTVAVNAYREKRVIIRTLKRFFDAFTKDASAETAVTFLEQCKQFHPWFLLTWFEEHMIYELPGGAPKGLGDRIVKSVNYDVTLLAQWYTLILLDIENITSIYSGCLGIMSNGSNNTAFVKTELAAMGKISEQIQDKMNETMDHIIDSFFEERARKEISNIIDHYIEAKARNITKPGMRIPEIIEKACDLYYHLNMNYGFAEWAVLYEVGTASEHDHSIYCRDFQNCRNSTWAGNGTDNESGKFVWCEPIAADEKVKWITSLSKLEANRSCHDLITASEVFEKVVTVIISFKWVSAVMIAPKKEPDGYENASALLLPAMRKRCECGASPHIDERICIPHPEKNCILPNLMECGGFNVSVVLDTSLPSVDSSAG